ncbi:hypothetical protein PSTG_11613 [Puccinia striiformis f. sp. tritici PST-78]|uniref:Uncharacterized protein n=2 Tax=Puccinia striiformis f. sp. tritici PST-78 TaxID=1165861 RepID=A0A0L0V6X2_9BASI|nr:hypothetical protein PSTG_11613 [Puccinia striiformis f. sp. tritici PST-78]
MMIFRSFVPLMLVIGQYTIASEIRMSGPVSKHPPPRINPSTEMSRLSLTSSSLRKPKLDGNLCREAEHRISIQDLSSTSQHGPSQGTGLARPELNSCSPQSTCTPTRQIISTDSAPPRQGGCLASYRRLPCVVQLAIPIIVGCFITLFVTAIISDMRHSKNK